MKTRIVYFGSPELSVSFLSALTQEPDFEIVGVVTQLPKPVGRKAILTKSNVHEFAEERSIPVFPFRTLKSADVVDELSNINADVFVVVVYGKIIPKAVLDIPKFGCINVHPSLLPKFRGPTPYHQAILEGETETGVSIMLLDEGMDTGPVLASTTFAIDPRETSETIQPKIVSIGVPLLIETMKKWITGSIVPKPQDNDRATYCKLLDKSDGKIDWNKSAVEIDRKIRAYQPWPGTWFSWIENDRETRVTIHDAIPVDRACTELIGTVVVDANYVYIVCGDSRAIELITLQPEGKNKMPASDYARGHKTVVGTNLIPS